MIKQKISQNRKITDFKPTDNKGRLTFKIGHLKKPQTEILSQQSRCRHSPCSISTDANFTGLLVKHSTMSMLTGGMISMLSADPFEQMIPSRSFFPIGFHHINSLLS
jgi:hypothetical protein